MREFFVFLLLSSSAISFGQFAIVADKDGYTNIRRDGATGSKIIDTLKNGHLMYCLENKENWTNADYTKKSVELTGYIYKDRYILISSYMAIPIGTQSDIAVQLAKDSIEIILTKKPFDRTKHKFTYYKQASDQIEWIDDKKYWGADGEMPVFEYQSVKIKLGRKTVALPKSALENLYEPNLSGTQVNYDRENDIIYVQSTNSDGAGFYEVIWKIEKGIYTGRLIAYGF